MWWWSPVVKKGVDPKFHEPWNGPYTVIKRLSDVTYEIQDQAKKKTKIVHFERLKKATLNSVKLYQSEEKEVFERSSESDSDFEHLAPWTRNVPKNGRAVEEAPVVDLVDVQETLADRPASPNQIIAEVHEALPVKSLAPKADVKVPVAPESADAKAQSGASASPTDAEGFRRGSTRTNKRNAPRR